MCGGLVGGGGSYGFFLIFLFIFYSYMQTRPFYVHAQPTRPFWVAKARGWQGCLPCFPNGIPRRKYSEYYRQLGMHGKSATMKIWAA